MSEPALPDAPEVDVDPRLLEILVCPVTAPSWAPVFGKIAATVTDVGGIMSHAAIVCPIPVEHQLPRAALGNHITIGGERRVAWQRERDASIFLGVPSRAGQAVLRRMDRIAGSLGREIRQE